jgi:hypothetical protein
MQTGIAKEYSINLHDMGYISSDEDISIEQRPMSQFIGTMHARSPVMQLSIPTTSSFAY